MMLPVLAVVPIVMVMLFFMFFPVRALSPDLRCFEHYHTRWRRGNEEGRRRGDRGSRRDW